MDPLVTSLKGYLREVLNICIEVSIWEGQNSLPLYLLDAYCFYETSILETRCLFMISKGSSNTTPGTILKHLSQIQKKWKGPIIYVQSVIASHNRKRLIEQSIPFIVPGNQMYLPHFGIDLREYFRKIHTKQINTFSPATQTLIIYALLSEAPQKLTASASAEKLGYTVMTMTRAFHDLQAAEIGEFYQEGRERYWTVREKRVLWEQAKSFLQSPVRKRVWLNDGSFKISAGLSALSQFSELAPPNVPEFAIGVKQWEDCKKSGIKELLNSDEATLELEIWNYNPEFFEKNGFVDPFSLFLSLEECGNERIELALEEMMEKFEW